MTPSMTCPGCGASLELVAGAGFVLAGCLGCGGAWIDNRCAQMVLANRLPQDLRDYVRALAVARAKNEAAGYRTQAPPVKKCPTCEKGLEEKPIAIARVSVDICDQHGTFFDRLELATLVTSVEHAAMAAVRPVFQQGYLVPEEPGVDDLVQRFADALRSM